MKTYLPIVVLLVYSGYFMTLCNIAKNEPFFRNDYEFVANYKAFYKLHEIPRNWDDANFYCQAEGASLAVPEDLWEAVAIVAIMRARFGKYPPDAFLGIHDRFSEGIFVSISGIPISQLYHDWINLSPDDSGDNEDCVVIRFDGKINDIDCQKNQTFVCKKTLQSLTINTHCENSDQEYFHVKSQSRCYKLHLEPRNWTDAYAVCEAEQSYMATINNEAEAKVLAYELSKYPKNILKGNFNKDVALLGIHNLFGDDIFYTLQDDLLKDAGYAQWGVRDPNRAAGHCGAMSRDGRLTDIACGSRALFFCEKELREKKQNINAPVSVPFLNNGVNTQ